VINRIGVLCQDRNSFGFLLGIARRLNCQATLIEPATGSLAKSTFMSQRQARIAVADLQRKAVDLIVRFTDADTNPWQEVKRHEEQSFPGFSRPILVCGVAVDNVEHWLALDLSYISSSLNLPNLASVPREELTGIVKHAIAQQGAPASEIVASIVTNAPADVFHSWLNADPSLRRFYQECRAAAIRSNCQVPNELDDTP
jgi:hypothetical protein